MKGAFNNEEAIGPLAVARQLHQHYSGKSRSSVGEIRREIMQGYFSMWEKCVIYQFIQWGMSYLLLYHRCWWGHNAGTDRHSGTSFTGTSVQCRFSLVASDKPSEVAMKARKDDVPIYCEWGGCGIQLVTYLHGIDLRLGLNNVLFPWYSNAHL